MNFPVALSKWLSMFVRTVVNERMEDAEMLLATIAENPAL